jgi:hypothetical protein
LIKKIFKNTKKNWQTFFQSALKIKEAEIPKMSPINDVRVILEGGDQ